MSPGSSTESHPAFARIGKKPQPGNLPRPGFEPGPPGFAARRADRYSTDDVTRLDCRLDACTVLHLYHNHITKQSIFRCKWNRMVVIGTDLILALQHTFFRIAEHLNWIQCIIVICRTAFCAKQTLRMRRHAPHPLSSGLIRAIFFPQLTRNERLSGWFQQDSATAHTAANSMHELRSVIGDRIISRGFWPPRSPDLSSCDFYLWGTLKDKVYASNPHTLQELKDNITREIQAISQHELLRVNQNCFRRYRDVFELKVITFNICCDTEDRDITYALFCSVLCIMEQVLFDEILILSVEENPHVYDKRRASYKDEKMKENTWLSIAASLNTDPGDEAGTLTSRQLLSEESHLHATLMWTGHTLREKVPLCYATIKRRAHMATSPTELSCGRPKHKTQGRGDSNNCETTAVTWSRTRMMLPEVKG
ncbi:hypothetical protein ANN_03805 [Periplaneta americana]|uniref:MADF domain-containing protein n=1 Tax=Periplaneta americana TaxID=6978 RepID=A0ABQ8U203_PERAM|nr:hypothetical protein ANN_03805 [Periplaneta americana]